MRYREAGHRGSPLLGGNTDGGWGGGMGESHKGVSRLASPKKTGKAEDYRPEGLPSATPPDGWSRRH
ncbi:hypothetical protein NL676_023160 [Syzygium grande]|nr:hypothetical protein NL676_023160 [Syzygium grande]